MTWRDEMKNPENVDELAGLIVGLTGFYGGRFCIEYKTLIEEFPFIDNEEAITQLIKELRISSIFIRKIKKINSTNTLENLGTSILLVQRIEI